MSDKQHRFVPCTPAGTMVFDIAAPTEEKAWENLLKAASHMPYKTKENFIKRGYEVIDMNDCE